MGSSASMMEVGQYTFMREKEFSRRTSRDKEIERERGREKERGAVRSQKMKNCCSLSRTSSGPIEITQKNEEQSSRPQLRLRNSASTRMEENDSSVVSFTTSPVSSSSTPSGSGSVSSSVSSDGRVLRGCLRSSEPSVSLPPLGQFLKIDWKQRSEFIMRNEKTKYARGAFKIPCVLSTANMRGASLASLSSLSPSYSLSCVSTMISSPPGMSTSQMQSVAQSSQQRSDVPLHLPVLTIPINESSSLFSKMDPSCVRPSFRLHGHSPLRVSSVPLIDSSPLAPPCLPNRSPSHSPSPLDAISRSPSPSCVSFVRTPSASSLVSIVVESPLGANPSETTTPDSVECVVASSSSPSSSSLSPLRSSCRSFVRADPSPPSHFSHHSHHSHSPPKLAPLSVPEQLSPPPPLRRSCFLRKSCSESNASSLSPPHSCCSDNNENQSSFSDGLEQFDDLMLLCSNRFGLIFQLLISPNCRTSD